MNIKANIDAFNEKLSQHNAMLVAVSKTKPVEALQEAYQAGQRHFGENKVQELADKAAQLPNDIKWHMIGHLQRNKVKYIAPFVHLIHAVDSLRLLQAIEKEGAKANRTLNVLLQVHIAREESKFGLSEEELFQLLDGPELAAMEHVQVRGLMGMATNTEDAGQVRLEFRQLKQLFTLVKEKYSLPQVAMEELSMGMSGDYPLALEEGSSMVRVGSAIFGARHYAQ